MRHPKPKKIDRLTVAYENPEGSLLPGRTVRVWQTLNRKPRYGLDHELTNKEIYAIGLITIQWAHLEHLLLLRTQKMADSVPMPIPVEATRLRFDGRLRAWRQMILHTVTNPDERNRLLKLHGRIANLEEKRHKITHGLWDFENSDPSKLKALSFRTPWNFEERFDIDKLAKLCDDIAEVNFALHFPDGPESLVPSSAYVNRQFLLELMGKDPGILRPQRSILPEPDHQQSSSEE